MHGRTIVKVSIMLAALMAGTSAGQAQEARHRRPAGAHPVRAAGLRPLTVRRHAYRYRPGRPVAAEVYDGPAVVRRWNDPNLYSFGGWRLGGDSFYGDTRGDPITRGNATLGMISGYGPARGGYGGPHFDSVGGFHNGPGPDAQEDADYASGSISTPDYGDIVPHYPSVKARVSSLMTGVPMNVGPVAYRPASSPPAGEEDGFLRADDLF